jgi:hypothetical protein
VSDTLGVLVDVAVAVFVREVVPMGKDDSPATVALNLTNMTRPGTISPRRIPPETTPSAAATPSTVVEPGTYVRPKGRESFRRTPCAVAFPTEDTLMMNSTVLFGEAETTLTSPELVVTFLTSLSIAS